MQMKLITPFDPCCYPMSRASVFDFQIFTGIMALNGPTNVSDN